MLHGKIIAITIMDEVVAVINSSFSSVLGGATGTSLVFIVHQSLVSLKHSMDQLLGGGLEFEVPSSSVSPCSLTEPRAPCYYQEA